MQNKDAYGIGQPHPTSAKMTLWEKQLSTHLAYTTWAYLYFVFQHYVINMGKKCPYQWSFPFLKYEIDFNFLSKLAVLFWVVNPFYYWFTAAQVNTIKSCLHKICIHSNPLYQVHINHVVVSLGYLESILVVCMGFIHFFVLVRNVTTYLCAWSIAVYLGQGIAGFYVDSWHICKTKFLFYFMIDIDTWKYVVYSEMFIIIWGDLCFSSFPPPRPRPPPPPKLCLLLTPKPFQLNLKYLRQKQYRLEKCTGRPLGDLRLMSQLWHW